MKNKGTNKMYIHYLILSATLLSWLIYWFHLSSVKKYIDKEQSDTMLTILFIIDTFNLNKFMQTFYMIPEFCNDQLLINGQQMKARLSDKISIPVYTWFLLIHQILVMKPFM